MQEFARRCVIAIGVLIALVGLVLLIAPPGPSAGVDACGAFPVFRALDANDVTYCAQAARSRAVTGLLVMGAAGAWTAWALAFVVRKPED